MGVNARQTKVGINIATSGSWGTGAAVATAVGTGDGHYVRGDLGIQLRMTKAVNDSAGQNFIGSVQVSNVEAIAVAIPTYLHYNDTFQNVLWALTMGTGGTAPSTIGTSTAYTNTFEPATNKTGRYATIVRDKVQYISEVPGAKFTGFDLSVGDNGRMEMVWHALGGLEKITSTINTATQVAAITFHSLGNRAFFADAVFRISTQAAADFGTTDVRKITGLSLKFNQPLDTLKVGGQTTIIEPEESGFPDVTLEVTFARFDSDSDDFWAAIGANTAYKWDLTLTGGTIDATSSYGLKFQCPNADVVTYDAPIGGGAGQVVPKMTLRGLSTTTAATGMTGITVPLRIVTTGTSTTNPFA
jgi:hypothetical protein